MKAAAAVLPDGTYDVLVVDAGETEPVQLDLTIVTGDLKGEVVTVHATDLGASWIDLMGMPATLVVSDGHPTVTIDR